MADAGDVGLETRVEVDDDEHAAIQGTGSTRWTPPNPATIRILKFSDSSGS
jgi:hypothetical protein